LGPGLDAAPAINLDPSVCDELVSLFNTIPFPQSSRSTVVGDGALTIGCVRGADDCESALTYRYTDVARALNNIMERHASDLGITAWSTIVINKNTVSDAHKDRPNVGLSAIMAVGSFQGGGEFVYVDCDPPETHIIKNRLLVIDGKREHKSNPYTGGDRFSVIFFLNSVHKYIKDRAWFVQLGFRLPPIGHMSELIPMPSNMIQTLTNDPMGTPFLVDPVASATHNKIMGRVIDDARLQWLKEQGRTADIIYIVSRPPTLDVLNLIGGASDGEDLRDKTKSLGSRGMILIAVFALTRGQTGRKGGRGKGVGE